MPYWRGQGLGTDKSPIALEVNRHEIGVIGLPAGLDGLTVAQISDLHIDQWNAAITEAAVDLVNGLKADLVVCTGDTIAEGKHYLHDVTYLLSQLKANIGKFACLGNHDYSDGEESLAVRRALRQADFNVLVNEAIQLTINQTPLMLAGADDLELGNQNLMSTARHWDDEIRTLLLCHNPTNFESIASFRPDLVLSGHTHGGQLPIPEKLLQWLLGSRFVSGHYWERDSQLYVNRGLGASVLIHHWMNRRLALPTPRWKVHAEVSLFQLTRASTPQPGNAAAPLSSCHLPQ
jgi:predicted MPP superfamily phosphohydrolase